MQVHHQIVEQTKRAIPQLSEVTVRSFGTWTRNVSTEQTCAQNGAVVAISMEAAMNIQITKKRFEDHWKADCEYFYNKVFSRSRAPL